MKKDSGGFQGFMLNYFEKIALVVFGALVLLFFVFALLGTYYDKNSGELASMVTQKETAVANGNPSSFQGLQGVNVVAYGKQLEGVPGTGGEVESVVIITPKQPPLNKRVMPELLPPTNVKAIGYREVLALNPRVGGEGRDATPGAAGGRGGGGGLGGDGPAGATGGGGAGGQNTGADLGGDLSGGAGGQGRGQGNRGGGNSNNAGNSGDKSDTEAKPKGYRPPGDQQTAVTSFIAVVGTVPYVAQDREFIDKTRGTLGGTMRPQYIAAEIQRRTKADDRWESISPDEMKQIIDEVTLRWVSSNVEEIVDERYVYPFEQGGQTQSGEYIPYYGFTFKPPPAIGRIWGSDLTTIDIPDKQSGPVYRPLDDVFGDWQATARPAATFTANKDKYDEKYKDQEATAPAIARNQQLVIARGEESDTVLLSTPGAERFTDQAFEIIDDGTGIAKLLNPKVAELRGPGGVILKHADQQWYEIYSKTSSDELKRVVILFLDGRDMATEAVVFEQTFSKFRQQRAFGATANNQDANQDATAEAAAPQGPSDFLLRFYDTTIEKGREYQYRVRFVIQNPNHGLNPSYLADPSDIRGLTVTTDWSEPTDWVSVAAYADSLVGPTRVSGATRDPSIKLFLREPSTDETPLKEKSAVAMLLTELDNIKRGQWLNFMVDNPVPIDVVQNAPAALELEEGPRGRKKGFQHRYQTDEMILDIHAGRHGKFVLPGEALVLDASGNLVVKSELDSGYAAAEAQYAESDLNKRVKPDDDDDGGDAGRLGGGLGGGLGDGN